MDITEFAKITKTPNLLQQVIEQLKIIWHKYGGVWMPGQTPLMNDIPLALQQDIAMEDFCWILTQVIYVTIVSFGL